MDRDIIIGIIIAAVALSAVILLTVTARASIGRIAANGCRTARETLKDKKNGQ
ncbi:MAG: hypothetical protein ACYSUT_04290 [Planctomycetota bacterium]|jgi:hypothetical protein